MTELKIAKKDNVYEVKAEGFYLEFPAVGEENQKALIIFLRSFKSKKNGKQGLFKQKQIAQALPDYQGETQQSIRAHEKHFEESGKNLGLYLKNKRKVDEQIVAAVTKELEKDPLANNRELAERVNYRLARTDITGQNIDAALEQIPARSLRKSIRQQMEKKSLRYKEQYLLEQSFTALQSRDNIVRTEAQTLLVRAGVEEVPTPAAKTVATITEADIKALFTVDGEVEQIAEKLKLGVIALRLYGNGMALRGLGQLLGVDKTTILRWIIAIALAVYPILMNWVKQHLKGGVIYLDEKWIKIKGQWHYWFVALDAHTLLPIVAELLPGRTQWHCQWFLIQLKASGYLPKVIVTDGLIGYLSAIASVFTNAVHQLCLFHHQQNVTKFAREHFADEQVRDERKREMKKVFQTSDKRTVRSRLDRLQAIADDLGISQWIKTVTAQLPHLLPAVGSRRIPATSNAIERFFRRFNQFYKHRNGFFSISSAKDQLILFTVFYFLTKDLNGLTPLESIIPDISRTPIYKLMNDSLLQLGFLHQQPYQHQSLAFNRFKHIA